MSDWHRELEVQQEKVNNLGGTLEEKEKMVERAMAEAFNLRDGGTYMFVYDEEPTE